MIIELPFPPQCLSPNARVHWSKSAGPRKRCRSDACLVARSVALKAGFAPTGRVRLDFTFHPTHNQKYDKDNLLARSKALIDGIADGLGINDRKFDIGNVDLAPMMKGGLVRIDITETA